jgi:hypothetical protein
MDTAKLGTYYSLSPGNNLQNPDLTLDPMDEEGYYSIENFQGSY